MTDYNWSADEILDAKMGENDADASTIRDYLKSLLTLVWSDGEGFDGKRPFGNSGWEGEIYATLVEQLNYDEDDLDVMDQAIFEAIDAL